MFPGHTPWPSALDQRARRGFGVTPLQPYFFRTLGGS